MVPINCFPSVLCDLSGRAFTANFSAVIRASSIFGRRAKLFVDEYANFIAKKNGKLGSAGTLTIGASGVVGKELV